MRTFVALLFCSFFIHHLTFSDDSKANGSGSWVKGTVGLICITKTQSATYWFYHSKNTESNAEFKACIDENLNEASKENLKDQISNNLTEIPASLEGLMKDYFALWSLSEIQNYIPPVFCPTLWMRFH